MITQLQLPVRFGGFGYLSAEVTSPSLYASATLAYAVHGAASIGAPTGLGVAALNMQGALTTLADKYPPLRPQVASVLQQPWPLEQVLKLTAHEKWSDVIHSYIFQNLVGSSAARDRVRLQCLQNSHSGAWLSLCPCVGAGLCLSNPEFKVLCRWRLGSELISPQGQACPMCGNVLDAFGDHLVCCHKNGLTKRHNAVVDCLAKFIKAAGLPVIVDRAVGLEPRLRPGDITLPR